MALVKTFASLLQTVARGKGVSSLIPEIQYVTSQAVTTLTAANDVISTTLDAAAGSPLDYEAIGFKAIDGQALDFGNGVDSISVSQSSALDAKGIVIGLNSKIDMGLGNDRVNILMTGDNAIGILNNGKGVNSGFYMGAGNDSVVIALSGVGSVGIQNYGSIDTGAGIDSIKVDGVFCALSNQLGAELKAGAGADRIDATSTSGHAINNEGVIDMGSDTEADRDVLTGNSLGHGLLTPVYTPSQFGIYNTGTIRMGGGRDVIDALVGGFGGAGGIYELGWTKTSPLGVVTQDQDADAVLGFGAGTFNGGGGRNSITLPDGNYKITYTTKPANLRALASGSITRNDDLSTVMVFNQFDSVGGSAPTAALHFAFAAPLGNTMTLDSFTIAQDGNLTAATYV